MNSSRRRLLATALVTPMMPTSLRASDWSERTIRLVAGGVGGVTDVRSRWLATHLATAMGQPVVVENIAAAGGLVGAAQVARSTPDGTTLLCTHQGLATITPHLNARMPYDPLKDFAAVTRLGYGPLLLTVHPGVPATTVRELIALARQRPGALDFGSPGIGTPPHIASELFKRQAGIHAVHVPYNGGGALLVALIGGQITWSMDGPTAQLPHVQNGRLRPLAVTGRKRLPSLPDVPTMAEAGLPDYEYMGWTGIAAPAATPRPTIDRLHAKIVEVAESDEGRRWFESVGAEPGTQTPEAFDAFIRREHAKWGMLVREAGIRAE